MMARSIQKKGRSLNRRSPMGRVAAILGATALSMMALVSPAHAAGPGAIDPATPVTLNVHKHAASSDGVLRDGDPLGGVQFTVKKVAGDIDLTDPVINAAIQDGQYSFTPADNPTSLTVTTTPDVAAPDQTADRQFALANLSDDEAKNTKTTNDAGLASWGPADGMVAGLYVAIEGNSTDATVNGEPIRIVEKAKPFLVALPYVNEVGQWDYTVDAYPKNAVTKPTKTITNPGDDTGKGIEYTITVPVPTMDKESNKTVTSLEITDVLDPRLTFVEGSIAVMIDGAPVDAQYYTASAQADENQANRVVVTVVFNTDANTLTWLNQQQGKNVVVTFKADANATGAIPNQAEIFIDDPGHTAGITTAEVDNGDGDNTANIGQLAIFKHDTAGEDGTVNALAGAEFELYRAEGTPGQETRGAKVEGLTAIKGSINADNNLVTGTDGLAQVKQLRAGTYFLVEKTAPNGYLLNKTPKKITVVDKDSVIPADPLTNPADGQNFWQIENTVQSGLNLPLTGSDGQRILAISGIAVVVLGAGAALVSRDRKMRRAV